MTRWALRCGLAAAMLFSACGDDGGDGSPAAPSGLLPDFDVALCDVPSQSPVVTPTWAVTATLSNRIVVDDDFGWIVQSNDHTVGRLDLATGEIDRAFIDLGAGLDEPSPWAVASHDAFIYVTNLATDSVAVASRDSGEVLKVVDAPFEGPGGLAVGGDVVLVANSGFSATTGEWSAASVTALVRIEEAPWLGVLGQLPTSADNAQYVLYEPNRGWFIVTSTGQFDFSSQDVLPTPGAIDVYDGALIGSDPEGAHIASIPLPVSSTDALVGAPGDMVFDPDGVHVWIASSTSPALFKLNLDTLTLVRGSENPVQAYLGTGSQITALGRRGDGLIHVAAFNEDALFVFDPACEASVQGPINLGESDLLEGPLDIAYDAVRDQTLILMSNSSAVARVR